MNENDENYKCKILLIEKSNIKNIVFLEFFGISFQRSKNYKYDIKKKKNRSITKNKLF